MSQRNSRPFVMSEMFKFLVLVKIGQIGHLRQKERATPPTGVALVVLGGMPERPILVGIR